MMRTAAICLVYAPAAPSLYFISSAFLFLMFIAQKVTLIKVYQRPPLIGDDVTGHSRVVMYVLCLAHGLSSFMFYFKQGGGTIAVVGYTKVGLLAAGVAVSL